MMLAVEDVAYEYEGARGVDGVTFEIGSGGTLIALAGTNGSGKSTLLKLIARVTTPKRGEIVFENRRDWPAKEYARAVGYLPQNADAAFPMRAIDVVVSGRAPYLSRFAFEGERDYEEAERALALCDASHLAGRELDEMSGGERKRVFLARVLAGRPRLVLLDEPFAALDIAHVQRFTQLLRGIADSTGAAVLFASHDLNWAAAYSDRMLVLRDGRLALDASPAQAMQRETLRDLFGFDSEIVERGGRHWVLPRL